ncbi:hypothetical protein [Streptomyces sp. NPDC001221]
MTTKTQLPPNLARHFYEARRRYLQGAGVTITPWFQLTTLERAVTEQETDLIRVAIEAAAAEQAIRDQLQPGSPAGEGAASQPLEDLAPPAEESTAAADDSRSEEPCDCTRCQFRRAIDALFEPPQPEAADAKGSDEEDCGHPLCRAIRSTLASLETPDVPTGATATVIPLDTRPFGVPLTEEELTRLQEAAERSLKADGLPLARLVTVGMDLPSLEMVLAVNGPLGSRRSIVDDWIDRDLRRARQYPLSIITSGL